MEIKYSPELIQMDFASQFSNLNLFTSSFFSITMMPSSQKLHGSTVIDCEQNLMGKASNQQFCTIFGLNVSNINFPFSFAGFLINQLQRNQPKKQISIMQMCNKKGSELCKFAIN